MPHRPYRYEDFARAGQYRLLQLHGRAAAEQRIVNPIDDEPACRALSEDSDSDSSVESRASDNPSNGNLNQSGGSSDSGDDSNLFEEGPDGEEAGIGDNESDDRDGSQGGSSHDADSEQEDVDMDPQNAGVVEEEVDGNVHMNGNVQLYPNAPVTVGESMHMILTFALSHNLSGKCIGDLLQLISLHCIEPNNCLTSLHLFKKYFQNVDIPVRRHYYCSHCLAPLDNIMEICNVCEEQREKSYYITIPIQPQLLTMLRREGFYAKLQHRFNRVKAHENNLEDVYDGELYQRQCRAGGFLSDRNAMSFCWNSDGVPVFKSSKYSIWPFFLRINELPYQERVRKENVILAGLWFGPNKPVPNMFLLPLIPELRLLSDGFEVKALVLNGTCDMPAKCLFLNFMSYNAYYGCTACTQRGERTPDNKHFYRFEAEPALRTEETTDEWIAMAEDVGEPVFGVKGVSILSRIVPNYVVSTAIDPMHKYSGITMKLLQIWLSPSFSDHPASISEHARLVDRRLCDIKPPGYVERLPRTLKHLKYFKISELKAFLFSYAIPCLHDLLDEIVFNHFLLLVCGLHLLNQTSISPHQVRLASSLLREFVVQFEDIYGLEHMTCNVHQLLHLGAFVTNLGPLYASSCAPFESMNGTLKKYVHGTRYADLQVCTAASLYMGLAVFRDRDLRENGPVQQFCARLSNRQKRLRLTVISDNVSAADSLKILYPVPARVTHALHQIHVNANYLQTCKKVFYLKRLYVAQSYLRAKKTISHCVKFHHGGNNFIGLIEAFIRATNCQCNYICECPAQCYAIIKMLETQNPFQTNAPPCVVSFVHECRVTNVTVAVRVQDFITQCFYIPVIDLNKIFVVEPVNNLENDD